MKKILLFFVLALSFCVLTFFNSCKQCNKEKGGVKSDTTDTSAAVIQPPVINYTHADTSLREPVEEVWNKIMDASLKKKNAELASMIVFRGMDPKRMGQDVFNYKDKDEKRIVDITQEVIVKWVNQADTFYTTRFLEMPAAEGINMLILEVLFISKKETNRKFFAFIKMNEEYKLLDISSQL